MNSFSFFYKTEDMKIFFSKNKYITLKDILNEINKIKDKNINKITIKKNNYDINFFNITIITFSFSIEGIKGINILKKPLIVKISGKEAELVCPEQLHYFLKTNYIDPKIKCIYCSRTINATIRSLNEHNSHNLEIFESNNNIPLKKDELQKKIFNNNIHFLGHIFDSPKSFEKNYQIYFDIDNKINLESPFHIYDDEMNSRYFIVNEFYEEISFGKRLNYFGASGKGKSVTLIGALKYENQYDNIGTLYINCKTLKILSVRGLTGLIRNIFCDEIEYLFPNDYEIYLSCFNTIMTFKITDNYSFWSIISSILEECYNIKNKRFIIGFDQYNESNDFNGELNKLEKKYIENNINKNFKFIVISSMNETDIRQQKINYLFDNGTLDNYFELNNICHFSSNYSGNELKVLEKLGNSFKAFNEIKLIRNENELEDYLKKKKKNIYIN